MQRVHFATLKEQPFDGFHSIPNSAFSLDPAIFSFI